MYAFSTFPVRSYRRVVVPVPEYLPKALDQSPPINRNTASGRSQDEALAFGYACLDPFLSSR